MYCIKNSSCTYAIQKFMCLVHFVIIKPSYTYSPSSIMLSVDSRSNGIALYSTITHVFNVA